MRDVKPNQAALADRQYRVFPQSELYIGAVDVGLQTQITFRLKFMFTGTCSVRHKQRRARWVCRYYCKECSNYGDWFSSPVVLVAGELLEGEDEAQVQMREHALTHYRAAMVTLSMINDAGFELVKNKAEKNHG